MDPRFDDREDRDRFFPHPYPAHAGYHSDGEPGAFRTRDRVSQTARIPSPPPTIRQRTYEDDFAPLDVRPHSRHKSSNHRVPSPPSSTDVRLADRSVLERRPDRVSELQRVPDPTGPPPVMVPPVSYAPRIPSPPPLRPIRHHRATSPPSSQNRIPSPPPRTRVPSPPPNHGFDGLQNTRRRRRVRDFLDESVPDQRDFESRPLPVPLYPNRRPFNERDRPRLPSENSGTEFLAPPYTYNSKDGGPVGGMRRWDSERTSNPRKDITGIEDGNMSARNSTGSVELTIASFGSSRSGVLGDLAYRYKPLQDMEFRLVRIFPERKTMIRCEILHSSIENPPPYTAISYAWGDAGNTRKIDLERSLVPVSVSLYGALEAVRQKSKSVMVWVDALCIDQQNKDERSQQVQLMTGIYSRAEDVAMWLGAEEEDSDLATDLLRSISDESTSPNKVSRLISDRVGKPDLTGIVSLFERDYWRRLWVVQEIFNARSITVYCGTTRVPWNVYKLASQAFSRHRSDLDNAFPGSKRDRRRSTISPNQLSASQVLVYQGPAGLPDLDTYMGLGEEALLAVLRACRRKFTSDAKDKVFGILGCLPEDVRNEFRLDYNLSVKEVYTEVVDYLLKTTERVDVICDAIHFPIHTGSHNLPSFVPDWSHIPQTTAMGHVFNFSASATTKATSKATRFLGEHLNKLEMSAIFLDTISIHGFSVGTLCTVSDYLMAFLHWRALLLGSLKNDKESEEYSLLVQEDFCKTMSLGQVPPEYSKPGQWLTITYYVFATLLRERLPYLPLDKALSKYLDSKVNINSDECRQFLQKHYGDRMMGRCFCRTKEGRIGMGAGLMLPGDVVVVPLGCSTPVLLRLEGTKGEYRFVGDVYINGYMRGRAVEQWNEGKRELKKYVLH